MMARVELVNEVNEEDCTHHLWRHNVSLAFVLAPKITRITLKIFSL
jgi:hypothetical protein